MHSPSRVCTVYVCLSVHGTDSQGRMGGTCHRWHLL